MPGPVAAREPAPAVTPERVSAESSIERTPATSPAGGDALSRGAQARVSDVLRTPGEPLDPSLTALLSGELAGEPPPAGPPPETGSVSRIGAPHSTLESQADRVSAGVQPLRAHDGAAPAWLGQVRIHTGERAIRAAETVNAQAFTVGRHIVFNRGAWQPGSQGGQQLLAHELAHVAQQSSGAGRGLLHRKPKTAAPSEPANGVRFWFSVRITRTMNPDELLVEFVRQYQRLDSIEAAQELKVKAGWAWQGSPLEATAADVQKGYKLIHVNDLSMKPMGAGEGELRKRQFGGLGGDEQSRINEETDRQFWARTGYKPGELLGKSADDIKMAEYWRQLRNELLRKREAIDSLAPNLKKFIFTEGAANTAGPKDYDAILRIADKLRDLTDAELQDYKNKVTGVTTSLTEFEASIDRYLGERAVRREERKTRETRRTRIYGTESLYQLYKNWKFAKQIAGIGGSSLDREGGGYETQSEQQQRADALYDELLVQLNLRGFNSVGEFEAAINAYIESFEIETLRVAEDMLKLYEHVLYVEEQRYRDPTIVQDLASKIAASPARQQYASAQEHRDSAWRSVSPVGGITATAIQKMAQAEADEAAAEKSVTAAATGHPLVANKDFDRKSLARAQPGQVAGSMLGYINDRRKDIAETRANLKDDPEIIWKLDDLYRASFKSQAIDPQSIYGMVVEDRRRDFNRKGIVKAIVVAVIAIAVTLLTFGTGTVAVLAAGAAFGLSAYQAIEAFREYEVKHAAYGAQLLSDDPSFGWVIVAIVGAGLDLGAAVTIFAKGTQAAKAIEAFNEAGDLIKLEKDLKAVAELTDGMRANVLKAAEAESEFRKAARSLASLGSRMYSNPFFDPELWVGLVKVVYYGMKRGLIAFDDFVKQLRVEKVLKEAALEADEVKHLTEAFEAAKASIETLTKHGKGLGLADEQIDTFVNMWAKSKDLKLEDVTAQMTKWVEKRATGIPFGIPDEAGFTAFKAAAVKGLKKEGYRDGNALLQGSAVTGVKWEGKIARLEPKDLDVALTSRTLFKKAEKLGATVERNPMRIGPLTADQIDDLGLRRMRAEMEAAAGGREVNFMLFANEDAARKGIQGSNPPSILLE